MTVQTNGHRNGHGGQRAAAAPWPAVPQHSVEAEEAVLGAAMLAEHATAWLVGNLREADFYRPSHRTVFAAIAQLATDGAPVDPATVAAALAHQGTLADMGGAVFLHTLVEAVPTASNVGYYGRVVKELAELRRVADLGARIVQLGAEPGTDPGRAVALAQGWLDELTRDGQAVGLRPPDLLDAVRERQRAKAAGKVATWGIAALDELFDGGLYGGSYTLLAALTSMGKSSLAIQTAAHNAEAGHVLYVTYEMTAADTGKHTFARIAGHSLAEATAFLDSPTLRGAREAHNLLDLTVFTHQPDAGRLLHETRSLHARSPLRLVVVDYVQKIRAPEGRRYGTRNEEVTEVSRLLKELALRCDVPVLACAQLNRGAVGRRPGLADLRDSGSLEQDADAVVFIHKPSRDATVADLLKEKDRMGPLGERRIAWRGRQAMFVDL